jgi:hypothetical protein
VHGRPFRFGFYGLILSGSAYANSRRDSSGVRAHGNDDRLPEASFWKGVQFWPEFVRMMATD